MKLLPSITRVIALTLVLALYAPMAHAAEKKNIWGASLLLGGIGVAALAWDYTPQCPDGYTTHTFQGLPTQCVRISSYGSDVINQPTNVEFSRPKLLGAGAAISAAGLILLMYHKAPPKTAPSIVITSQGWRATKSFYF